VNKFVVIFCVFFVNAVLAASPSEAAEIKGYDNHDFPREFIMTINGTIKKGDFDKFKSILIRAVKVPVFVSVNSLGGNILEAMKIGSLIRKLNAGVRGPRPYDTWDVNTATEFVCLEKQNFNLKDYIVPPGTCSCMSACFYIWIADDTPLSAVVGIHSPTMVSASEKYDLDSFSGVYNDIETVSKAYLRKMGLGPEWFAKMTAIPSNSIRLLTEDEMMDVMELSRSTQEWLSDRCGSLSPEEISEWNFIKQLSDIRRKQYSSVEDGFYMKEDLIEQCEHSELKAEGGRHLTTLLLEREKSELNEHLLSQEEYDQQRDWIEDSILAMCSDKACRSYIYSGLSSVFFRLIKDDFKELDTNGVWRDATCENLNENNEERCFNKQRARKVVYNAVERIKSTLPNR